MGNANRFGGTEARRGSALVSILPMVTMLAGLSVSMLLMATRLDGEQRGAEVATMAFYTAEAGVNRAVAAMGAGWDGCVTTLDGDLGLETGPCAVSVTSVDEESFLVVSEAEVDGWRSEIELVVSRDVKSVFPGAVFGAESVVLQDNALIDSYDSSRGTYLSQQVHLYGAKSFASSKGIVGSNGEIWVQHQALVFGHVRSGPDHDASQGTDVFVSGPVVRAPSIVELPEVDVPAAGIAMPFVLVGRNDVVLPGGDYHLSSLLMGDTATLTIQGPSSIVIDRLSLMNQSVLYADPSAGAVRFVLTGDVTIAPTAGIINLSTRPSELELVLLGDNIDDPATVIELDAVRPLFAMVYAPSAHLSFFGPGRIFGAVAARRVTIGGTFRVHFDEALIDIQPEFWSYRSASTLGSAVATPAGEDEEEEDESGGGSMTCGAATTGQVVAGAVAQAAETARLVSEGPRRAEPLQLGSAPGEDTTLPGGPAPNILFDVFGLYERSVGEGGVR